jgi:replicative DNA helicase
MNLILHRIIASQDLGAWSKIKKEFFAPPYDRIYSLILSFYNKFNKLPTFSELQTVIRNENDLNIIKALELLEVPEDIETDIILQAFINEYAQGEILSKLSRYVDDIAFKDANELIEELNTIALEVEEKTEVSEQVVMMNDFTTIDKDEITSRVPLGLSNAFDEHTLGLAPSEMITFGGYRGSGKSLVCSNVACNQFEQGHPSLYFTIEMRGREIFQRNLSILSGVENRKIKSGNLDYDDQWKIAKVRASMTIDGAGDLLEEFEDTRNFTQFERKLIERPLNTENQIVTIDNPRLTLANIDATISTFKSKFQDSLKVVIVDYINKISENDPFEWKTQVHIATKLKDLAAKYDVVMVSPYQVDKKGEARFAKGILDPVDWAFTLSPHKSNEVGGVDAIEFNNVKARGGAEKDFVAGIDWNTLKIIASETPELTKTTIKGAKNEKPQKAGDDL